ncbi:MAG: acetylornithine transaminase [Actinobacteria bacterium]|nr:acetylornithine transaminase [Actinomycetota bacterium]
MNPVVEKTNSQALAQKWSAVMMNNYGVPGVAISHGRGSRVWDLDGNEYLDLIAGIATSTLGHAHPDIQSAVNSQLARITHTSNLFMHEPGVDLAAKLVELVGQPAKVFFSQDGATANEAAIKLSRRHGWLADPAGGKLELVAAERSFHGRTMGALAVTGSAAKQDPFLPMLDPVSFVPYGDVDALAAAVTDRTAAVFLEPVLGEGGVISPPDGYLAAAREIATAHNALLVIDEVQSGIGRTGEWFVSLSQGVTPDIITLAKGLAGGLPLGACIGIGAAGELFVPGNHGSTFGGNPVSCAAALAVVNAIERDEILGSVKSVGDHWIGRFRQTSHPNLAGVRGSGLWLALELSGVQASDVQRAAQERGFLVNAVAPDAIRLAPPLTLSIAEAQEFADALPDILDNAGERS